ncbi:LINE-1 retrotransposable element ORF2 protein, partial [Bienertia sinuspersici]
KDKVELIAIQEAPSIKEKEANKCLVAVQQRYTSFLKKKSKLGWPIDGDENTRLFRQSIRIRQNRNRILSVTDMNGVLKYSHKEVQEAFIAYYKSLLGTSMEGRRNVDSEIVKEGPVLNAEQVRMLHTNFFGEEIKQAIWGIDSAKAPGYNGYNSKFFKEALGVVGGDVTHVIDNFFATGKLLKEINITAITLIPKGTNPTLFMDYRPISCCSVLYKCIAKLLCSRLKMMLPDL